MRTAFITDIHIGFNSGKLAKFKKFIQTLVEGETETLVITGDIACNRVDQIEQAFRVIREVTTDMKVLVIFGNHDYWDAKRKFTNIFQLIDYRQELCRQYDVQYLHTNHFENETVQVFGFDGWYTVEETGSNDNRMMPGNSLANFHILREREIQAVEYIIKHHNKEKKVVVVTHFNPFADDRKWQIMSGNGAMFSRIMYLNPELYVYGHTHNVENSRFDNGTRIVNVGADYQCAPRVDKYHLAEDL